MRLFHGTDNAKILRPTVLTLGVFDGLHLGHQLIMRRVVERAERVEAVPTCLTFDPHPRAVLYPEKSPPLLQTLDQRLENLNLLGIKQTIVIPFSREFAKWTAEDFLRDIVRDRLRAIEVYLGRGFAFGRGREGTIEFLIQAATRLGFHAEEVEEVCLRGTRISSTLIRELLQHGRVNLARRCLGRPYGIEGRVIHGDQRGRTIGFPTANTKPTNRVIPKRGVYVTATWIDNVWRKSITNVGVRPTFTDDVEPSIETHVIDWTGDLYDDVVRTRFLHRLRDERKFAGLEDLKRQITYDTNRARKYFTRSGVRRALTIE